MHLCVDTKAERLYRLTWTLFSVTQQLYNISNELFLHTKSPPVQKKKKKVHAQLIVKQLWWFMDQLETRCTPVEFPSKRELLKRPETVSTLSFAVYFGDRSKWELSVGLFFYFFCLYVQRMFTHMRGSLGGCVGGGLVELPAASSGIKDICLNHRRGGQKHGNAYFLLGFLWFMATDARTLL